MRKVIYVLGANWSGTTLLGSVLGATRTGGPYRYFHVGELHALFKAGKGTERAASSPIWADFIRADVTPDLMHRIASSAHAEVIIDSSKILNWVDLFKDDLEKRNVEVRYVVAFRPFDDVVRSGLRRGKSLDHCVRSLSRYEKYLRVLDPGLTTIVDVSKFTSEPTESTIALCAATGVEYFDGKELYWKYPADHLYGASTQRRHYEDPESAGYYGKSTEAKDLSEGSGISIPPEIATLENRLRLASSATSRGEV